jgi:molybdopterin-binding protein
MGFLKKLFGGRLAAVQQLPTGTITVDRAGQVVTSTVSSAYPKKLLQDIGRDVLALFREARVAQMPLAEVSLHFGSLDITARELRGGAIIFLFPQTALSPTPTTSRL